MCEAEKDIVKQINKACEKYKECKTYDLSIVLLTGTLWKIFECIMCCWTNSASNELHLLLWTWISSLPYEREVWMLSLVLLVVVLFSVVCVCVCMCVCVCGVQEWGEISLREKNHPQILLSNTEQRWKLVFASDLIIFLNEFNHNCETKRCLYVEFTQQ